MPSMWDFSEGYFNTHVPFYSGDEHATDFPPPLFSKAYIGLVK